MARLTKNSIGGLDVIVERSQLNAVTRADFCHPPMAFAIRNNCATTGVATAPKVPKIARLETAKPLELKIVKGFVSC